MTTFESASRKTPASTIWRRWWDVLREAEKSAALSEADILRGRIERLESQISELRTQVETLVTPVDGRA
jgi:polyhydroxyalkanoate synthesis regulator phasin